MSKVSALTEKAQDKSVQSLIRGLNVLIAVNENTPATVTKVVASTGLPKATVIRFLKTLRADGYIEMDNIAGGYKATPKVRLLASPMILDTTFTTFVRHYLNDFAQIIKWPTELLMPEGSSMVVQASNRTTAPIQLKRFEQARFSLLSSSSGLAYLSACSKIKQQQLISSVVSLKTDTEASHLTENTYQNIETTLQRGYAESGSGIAIEETYSISIPLLANAEPFGSLALIFLRDAVSEAQLHDFLLPKLRNAAEEISKIFSLHGNVNHLAPMSTYGVSSPTQK